MKVKGIISEKTIVLKNDKGDVINIQQSEDPILFKRLVDSIIAGEQDLLRAQFTQSIDIEEVSEGMLTIVDGRVVIEGSDVPIPSLIARKLSESRNSDDFLPLLRFWIRLSKNPSQDSRKQLYGFMEHNNIPITNDGYILCEKGVLRRNVDGVDQLVDAYTRKIDNSIGRTVQMLRDSVDSNPEQTCSYGLHVGAPEYVRSYYSDHVIIECLVDPADVVSVPIDYAYTKMRVCKYKVLGLAKDIDKLPERKVEALSTPKRKDTRPKERKSLKAKDSYTVISESPHASQIEGMTAREIVAYVKEQIGEEITGSLKNKQSIIKKALRLLEIHANKAQLESFTEDGVQSNQPKTPLIESGDEIDISGYSESQLIDLAKAKFNEIVSDEGVDVRSVVKALLEKAGYKVKD